MGRGDAEIVIDRVAPLTRAERGLKHCAASSLSRFDIVAPLTRAERGLKLAFALELSGRLVVAPLTRAERGLKQEEINAVLAGKVVAPLTRAERGLKRLTLPDLRPFLGRRSAHPSGARIETPGRAPPGAS